MGKVRDKKIELQKIISQIVPLLKQQGVIKAGIFGSYARGDQKKNSDIDILIQVKDKKFSLFDLVGLELELKKILRKDVDLLTYNGLNHLIREEVLKEEVRII
ncbi:MAG: nucleotidyltransferase family protein [Nanoarchaeota archaeon]